MSSPRVRIGCELSGAKQKGCVVVACLGVQPMVLTLTISQFNQGCELSGAKKKGLCPRWEMVMVFNCFVARCALDALLWYLPRIRSVVGGLSRDSYGWQVSAAIVSATQECELGANCQGPRKQRLLLWVLDGDGEACYVLSLHS